MKEKKLIKEIFEDNITAMLEEMSKLHEEGKFYREEIRKIIAQKKIYQNMLKDLLANQNQVNHIDTLS